MSATCDTEYHDDRPAVIVQPHGAWCADCAQDWADRATRRIRLLAVERTQLRTVISDLLAELDAAGVDTSWKPAAVRARTRLRVGAPDPDTPTVAEMAGLFKGGPDSVTWLRGPT